MIRIELTGPEILLGANVGVLRRYHALMRGRRETVPEIGGSWTEDINGAHAEEAVAKYRNVFWSGTVGRVDLPDVGRWQVRSKREPNHCLVVRPNDRDDDVFICVLVEALRCTLTGWLYGWEAKQERFWRPANSAFFVPDKPDGSELRPIESLPAI